MKRPSFDPYEVLGLPHNATDRQVKAAYRRLALEHHPDRSRHPDAQVRFVRISDAYDLLTDPGRRRTYDEQVAHERRLQTEAVERARQQEAEQQREAQALAERARRTAAQREQARRAQAEREAQMSRILGHPHREDPEWQAGDKSPPPRTWVAPDRTQELYEIRESAQEDARVGPNARVSRTAAGEPAAAEPLDADEVTRRGWWTATDTTWAVAALVTLVASGGGTLWYALQGAWIAALLSLILLPVPLFVLCLGAFYPLAALLVAISAMVRVPLKRPPGGRASSQNQARIRRLILSYSVRLSACLFGAALVAWLGLVVAPEQSHARQEPLKLACGAAAFVLGYYALAMTFHLMFGLLDGRESLFQRPRTDGGDEGGMSSGRRKRRESRACCHTSSM